MYVCSHRTKPGCIYRGVTRLHYHCGVPGLQRAPRSWGPMWVPSADSGSPMHRGHPLRLPVGTLLSSRLSPPSCRLLHPRQAGSAHAAGREGGGAGVQPVGGLKSGSPPCQTGPGLWQQLSFLQRKKARAGGEVKSISMAPIPLKGRQQVYCWSSLPQSVQEKCSAPEKQKSNERLQGFKPTRLKWGL